MREFIVEIDERENELSCNVHQLTLRCHNGERHEAIDIGPPMYDNSEGTRVKGFAKWLEQALPDIQRTVIAAELREMADQVEQCRNAIHQR